MATAQDRLNQILPSWYDLLTQWSLDGSLVAAATDALVLESSNAKQDAKGQLQSYVSQWSGGNFQNLPQIVLLSAEDISGALGAYADSTDTIYLNQEWLMGASEEEIQKVLTEELGHYFDDQLNKRDTKGDEGALFSLELFQAELSNLQKAAIKAEDDDIQIRDDKFAIDGEASISTSSFSPVLNLDFNGTSIQDTSSFNNPVTVLGTVLLSNSQALFNGIDSAVRIDSGQGFPLNKDFKISFDITWDSQDDNSTTTLIDKRQSGLGIGGWSLRLVNDVVYWEGIGSAIGGNYFLSAPIERDIQHKVEVSRISGTIRLSIDGAEIASIYDPTDYTNSHPIRIANNQDFGPDYGSRYFKGLLDNISISVGADSEQVFVTGTNDQNLFAYDGGNYFYYGGNETDTVGLYYDYTDVAISRDHLGIYTIVTDAGIIKTTTTEALAFTDQIYQLNPGLAEVYWFKGQNIPADQYFVGGLNNSEVFVYDGGNYFYYGGNETDTVGLYYDYTDVAISRDHLGIYTIVTDAGIIKTTTTEALAFTDQIYQLNPGLAEVYWFKGQNIPADQYFVGGLNNSEVFVYDGGNYFYYGGNETDTVGLYYDYTDVAISRDHLGIYTIVTDAGIIKTTTTEALAFTDQIYQLNPGLAEVYWQTGLNVAEDQYQIGGLNNSEIYVYSGGDHFYYGGLGSDILGLYYNLADVEISRNASGNTVVTSTSGSVVLSEVEYISLLDFVFAVGVDNGDAGFAISGTPVVGQQLTAKLTKNDPDGNGTFTYLWEVSTSTGWEAVGIDSDRYIVASADAGKQIRVTVMYEDKQGIGEMIIAPTVSIPSPVKLIGDGNVNTDLIGSDSDDRMSGKGVPTPTASGPDIIDGKGGFNDIVYESGNYNFKISGAAAASTVVGSTTTKVGGRTNNTIYINDSITNVEGVEITGGASANTLDASAYAGRANLNGDAGADTLIGGTGPDVLTGGLGADIFKFVVKPSTLTAATADRITDFKSAESDKIQVSRSAFGIASTAKVTLTTTADINKGLTTSSLFVLDTTTGYLHYNANSTVVGAGTSGGIFAALDKIGSAVPTLSASNIALV